MSKLGTTAPNFTLPNQKKEMVTLESLRGKKVVLAFFPAAFTRVCEKELCTFRDGLANLNTSNGTVLGICVDAPFSNAAFAEKNNLTFPVLSDYTRSAVNAYGVAHEDFAGLPGYVAAKRSVFVVDTTGKITFEWIAENPGVEPDYAAVTAAVAAAS